MAIFSVIRLTSGRPKKEVYVMITHGDNLTSNHRENCYVAIKRLNTLVLALRHLHLVSHQTPEQKELDKYKTLIKEIKCAAGRYYISSFAEETLKLIRDKNL